MKPPRRKRQERQEGNPRQVVTFRPSAEVREFLEAQRAKDGLGLASTLDYLLTIAMHVVRELGDDNFRRLEGLALIDKKSPGTYLAEMAKASLKSKR